MERYTELEILRASGLNLDEIEEMDSVEKNMRITEEDFRYCENCNSYVSTDFYSGEPELCDECLDAVFENIRIGKF